ncbi:hypothetical protein [Vogesella indigofera]|uniref:hypothetical protein n=1 Tax=Vogesella indigofera TaxID=45465 RepID=UPI00234E70A3|nr:hypothetical protein [Vogesella indigofera]MDC7710856.1 hypothetical protein [Vogesella indigofera]
MNFIQTDSNDKASPSCAASRGTAIAGRRVYYFSGFDPKGPRHYHRLYHGEAARQDAVSGQNTFVGARRNVSKTCSHWEITQHSCDKHQQTHTDYNFMRWDDIIRQHWHSNEFRLLIHLCYSLRVYLQRFALFKVLVTSWPPFVTAMYPMCFLFLLLGLATGLGLAIWSSAALVWPLLLPASLGVTVGVLWLGRLVEKKLNVYWLLRIYCFTARWGTGKCPEMEKRLDEFTDQIVRENRELPADEILLIGHSVGTMLATAVAARVFKHPDATQDIKNRLSLLTLGHCVPVLSFISAAHGYRQELSTLAARAKHMSWVDFTAPTDGACFALISPLTGCNRPEALPEWPKLLSPRYATLFHPVTYQRIRRDRYRQHFQYLMASELPGDYDYFAITAGNQTLAQRFAHHKSVQQFDKFKVFSK